MGKGFKLSYKDGVFFMRVSRDKRRLVSADNCRDWTESPLKTASSEGLVLLQTTSIKAALAWREVADESASRFFNRILVKRYPLPTRALPSFLDPHQVEGVKWALSRSACYLAHAPGAGKSLQVLTTALYAHGTGPVIIVTPPSIASGWVDEIIKWWPKLYRARFNMAPYRPNISVLSSSLNIDVDWDSDFVVVHDTMLTSLFTTISFEVLRPKVVAVDEASRFKECTSQRTIALFGGTLNGGRKVRGVFRKARHAILLDGSPMPNRSMELWAPTYALSPESIDFMSREEFGHAYCGPTTNRFGHVEFKHSSNEATLKEKLQQSFMHVVKESDLKHPERKRKIVLTDEDVRTIDVRNYEERILSGSNFKLSDADNEKGELALLMARIGLKKVPFIADYVGMRLEPEEEKILLFVWHRTVAFELWKRLKRFRPGLIVGGASFLDRSAAIEKFQDGSSRLIILNIAAGGRGLNGLQGATRVVFGEYAWNDETNKQCEKRVSRKGSDAVSVPCDYIVARQSVDEMKLRSLFTKQRRVKKVIG